ncbi:MAG TPA: hypothetical protein VMZ22_08070 [Acidimicrobiales bacterium]|nr:hypothetical protein [Acidimicrobiales bacterium]
MKRAGDPIGSAPDRPLLTHPAFVASLGLTLLSEWLLPRQYRPVLFRQDLEMLALSCSLLAGGAAYASYRRAAATGAFKVARVVEAAAATFAAFALGALWMRFAPHGGVTGIGAPRRWVVALVVVWAGLCAAAGAVLGARVRERRLTGAALAAVMVLSSVLGLVVASAELNSQPAEAAVGRCVQRRTVRYCHYRGYGPFVTDWAVPVEAVLRELPEHVLASRPLLVRQGSATGGAHHLDLDAIATPLLQWSPSSTARLSLALDTANSFVRVNDDYKPGERNGRAVPHRAGFGCSPGGDSGRMVVAWWLAGQVDAGTRRQVIEMAIRDPAQDAISGSGYAEVVGGGPTPLAAQLLARDDAEIGAVIRARWADLTARDVGVGPVMELFGLEPSAGVGPSRKAEDPRELPRGCPAAPRR